MHQSVEASVAIPWPFLPPCNFAGDLAEHSVDRVTDWPPPRRPLCLTTKVSKRMAQGIRLERRSALRTLASDEVKAYAWLISTITAVSILCLGFAAILMLALVET